MPDHVRSLFSVPTEEFRVGVSFQCNHRARRA
jgi:hypothetical protein